MVSAERVMAYGKLESEASLETVPPSSKPPSDWPSEGRLEINDLSYRHSSEGPLVLKGITCTVKSGEKVSFLHVYYLVLLFDMKKIFHSSLKKEWISKLVTILI